jgi:ribonucleoside-diphosphate reductase alpha chain
MTNPQLFNPEVLRKGAQIVVETNREVAAFLGINPSARTTTTKPSGNASVILGTTSGIHPDHARRYFRIMQLNKESETAKWLAENMPEVLEESVWSANNTDYVVFTPIENSPDTIVKEEMTGVKHLELIKLVKENWVDAGKVKELCYNPSTSHNVSNTVIIDDMEQITDYVYDNMNSFAAVSFITAYGDKDYNQAPFTSVLDTKELIEKYGDGVIFMSGLIVDGLHYFNGNLWEATDYVLNKDRKIVGTREQVLLRKDWIRRVHKFAKNYFKKDLQKTIYCMKDVHLWHKWNLINRNFKVPDFTEILKKPVYSDIDKYSAVACSGGACEVNFQ